MIEAANKRMAEVHARKETQATKSADKVDEIHNDRAETLKNIEKDEQKEIQKAIEKHSGNVVAAQAESGSKVKANDKKFKKGKKSDKKEIAK